MNRLFLEHMNAKVSVVICSHNPQIENLNRVLIALKAQSLDKSLWELLLIDNASKYPLCSLLDLSWHSNARHISEEKVGLTNARLRAFKEAKSDVIVFVDDDNILTKTYVSSSLEILAQNPKLGAIGGKSLPEFVEYPDSWFFDTGIHLGLRDLGDDVKVEYWTSSSRKATSERQYPFFAPIGAGLVIRKAAAAIYARQVAESKLRLGLGRTGKQLTSGEDNDIVLTLLENGWGVGYFPQLSLTHIIPPNRLSKEYLSKLSYESSRSWIKVLDAHGIRPWGKIPLYTVPLRKAKSFFFLKAWTGTASYITWRGACGKLHGQSELK